MSSKGKISKKHKNKAKKIVKKINSKLPLVLVTTFIFFSLVIFVFTVIRVNQNFAANFADNILRPLLGNKTTIYIESLFFGIEDHVNQVKYKFVKSNQSDFTAITPGVNKSVDNLASLKLDKISSLSYFPLFPGEGEWARIYNGGSQAFMAKTFVRPDPERSYAIAYLVKIEMNDLSLSAVAGIREPGGKENPGPGKIPEEVQKQGKLIAAFNGGFQEKDGHYGMIVGSKTYLPLLKNLATLVIYSNKNPRIFDFRGQDLGENIVAIRQNGPMLLKNTQDVTSSSEWNMQTWGLTTTNSMYTWRSGIGVTDNGDLIYAAGPSLVPKTLALALKAAGAVNAMQLDINPVWVRFMVFTPLEKGGYSYYPLTQDMTNGGYQDLTGYQKDFFYLTRKK